MKFVSFSNRLVRDECKKNKYQKTCDTYLPFPPKKRPTIAKKKNTGTRNPTIFLRPITTYV